MFLCCRPAAPQEKRPRSAQKVQRWQEGEEDDSQRRRREEEAPLRRLRQGLQPVPVAGQAQGDAPPLRVFRLRPLRRRVPLQPGQRVLRPRHLRTPFGGVQVGEGRGRRSFFCKKKLIELLRWCRLLYVPRCLCCNEVSFPPGKETDFKLHYVECVR